MLKMFTVLVNTVLATTKLKANTVLILDTHCSLDSNPGIDVTSFRAGSQPSVQCITALPDIKFET